MTIWANITIIGGKLYLDLLVPYSLVVLVNLLIVENDKYSEKHA
jgi:hypothetical protein